MKKYLALAMFIVLAVVLTSPVSVSAKTKAGTKPGNFFYFFDKAIEKTSLFFIFNPEKKAKKTLEYAEERLAEAEELKKEKEEKESPEIKKEEVKQIKTSEKEIEKTDNKLEEENEEETEIKDSRKEEVNKKDEQSKEIEKLKKEIEVLKKKTSQIKIVDKIVEKPVIIENKQSSNNQASSQTKQKEVTLPNGAVVEMDENGNVVRTIKEALEQTYTPVQTSNLNKENSKIITIKELDGSYQQRNNRNAVLYFSIYNNSDVEAHINSVNMQLFGYGFLPNTEATAYLQDNAGQTLGVTQLQHSSKSATSSITIQLTMNLDQPLIVYEKSQKNFRIIIIFTTIGSEINMAKLLNVSFGGVTASNFSAQGLPITIYTKKVEIGGTPEGF